MGGKGIRSVMGVGDRMSLEDIWSRDVFTLCDSMPPWFFSRTSRRSSSSNSSAHITVNPFREWQTFVAADTIVAAILLANRRHPSRRFWAESGIFLNDTQRSFDSNGGGGRNFELAGNATVIQFVGHQIVRVAMSVLEVSVVVSIVKIKASGASSGPSSAAACASPRVGPRSPAQRVCAFRRPSCFPLPLVPAFCIMFNSAFGSTRYTIFSSDISDSNCVAFESVVPDNRTSRWWMGVSAFRPG